MQSFILLTHRQSGSDKFACIALGCRVWHQLIHIIEMYYDREQILAKGKKKEKAFVRIFGGVFISVGVIMYAVCIYTGVSGYMFRQKAEPVDAVIVAMVGADSESLGTPEVEYVLDGRHYTSTLNFSSSSMHPGKQITVYCDPDDPYNVRYLDDNGWLVLLFLFIGTVFGGMGTAFVVVKRRHDRRIRMLLDTGRVVEADITDISLNTGTEMNGRHPIVVSCRYTASDGRVYLFRSGSFWYGSHEINPAKKVRVYIDRDDPSKYYVDVDSVVG